MATIRRGLRDKKKDPLMTTNPGYSMLADLSRLKAADTGRLSSWDRSGRNQDYWLIPANSTVRLADIEGPRCITHIWMTQFCPRLVGPGPIDPPLRQGGAPALQIHTAPGLTSRVP